MEQQNLIDVAKHLSLTSACVLQLAEREAQRALSLQSLEADVATLRQYNGRMALEKREAAKQIAELRHSVRDLKVVREALEQMGKDWREAYERAARLEIEKSALQGELEGLRDVDKLREVREGVWARSVEAHQKTEKALEEAKDSKREAEDAEETIGDLLDQIGLLRTMLRSRRCPPGVMVLPKGTVPSQLMAGMWLVDRSSAGEVLLVGMDIGSWWMVETQTATRKMLPMPNTRPLSRSFAFDIPCPIG